ncbi:MAG: hypothetical protein H6740_06385 [Alphaproteobacteria bacterium]|nr:hypothetical protein [Alphaproteobacteria bacterium]
MSANSTRLEITGPAPSWGADAREGELTRSDGRTLPVLVRLLRDQPSQPRNLATLQVQARDLARCRNDHLLRLINVSAVGGNAALVYVRFDGLSLLQVLNAQRMRGGWLPVKVCLEMAAMAAQGIATLSDTVARTLPDHRVISNGPGTEDILIDNTGQLRVARVLVTGPGDPPHASLNPGYTPPEGPDSLQANVYGLGALTLSLLSTQPPPLALSDLRQHDAQLQQAVGMLSQRPGEAVPRAAAQLIRLAMTGNHLVRPSTLAMATQLTELAGAMRGPDVAAWAGASIPRLRAAAMSAPLNLMPDLPPAPPLQQAPLQPLVQGPPPPRHRPLPSVAPLAAPPVGRRHVQLQESVDDDPTARQDGLLPLAPLGAESEATQESQLPAGFFDQPTPEASPGGVGMGLFRSVDLPVELDPSLDPALEATMMIGQTDTAEEPTVALTQTAGLEELTEDPDAKTEALPAELRDALRAGPPPVEPTRPPSAAGPPRARRWRRCRPRLPAPTPWTPWPALPPPRLLRPRRGPRGRSSPAPPPAPGLPRGARSHPGGAPRRVRPPAGGALGPRVRGRRRGQPGPRRPCAGRPRPGRTRSGRTRAGRPEPRRARERGPCAGRPQRQRPVHGRPIDGRPGAR